MPTDPKHQGQPRPNSPRYEKRDASAKWIFGIVAFMAVAGLIMHFWVAGFMGWLQKTPAPSDRWTGARVQPAVTSTQRQFPRLQISPPRDLEEFRARQQAELNSYGWIDRTAGVVRVPVDRAMDLVLERGLPTRGTNENRK